MRLDSSPGPARSGISGRWLALAAGLLALVTALSFLPLRDKVQLHTKGMLHYPGHMLAFGGLAMLLGLAVRSHAARLLTLLAALGFGFLVEFSQHILNREAMEWTDVQVDVYAVLIGMLLVYLFRPNPQR